MAIGGRGAVEAHGRPCSGFEHSCGRTNVGG